ncbi:lytic transglycosylase domain-containing protein [Sinosporangium siamense]|nr:lytic transglycosylase domain-containing protein [Sinosporangium siamense]
MIAPLIGLTVAISGCGAQGIASSGAADQAQPTRPATGQSANPQPGDPKSGDPQLANSHMASKTATTPTPAPAADAPALPDPDVAIPKDPAKLARALSNTSASLQDAIDDWRESGKTGAKGQPPEPVVLLTLHQQRIYRFMARNQSVASRTYPKLPKALAAQARDNVTAIVDLLSLVRPIKGTAKFRVEGAEPADVLLRHFRRAERKFGVDWEVLASVMFVETKFGRVRSPSHTGAKGPMQFMPRTWEAYGMGGNVHDTQDAIFAAANYLRASGAPRNYRRALWAYNHSYRYVNAVQLHARQIKQDIRNFYAYYNWQVYVVTTQGDRRLSGP